jgi:hypothetical protein
VDDALPTCQETLPGLVRLLALTVLAADVPQALAQTQPGKVVDPFVVYVFVFVIPLAVSVTGSYITNRLITERNARRQLAIDLIRAFQTDIVLKESNAWGTLDRVIRTHQWGSEEWRDVWTVGDWFELLAVLAVRGEIDTALLSDARLRDNARMFITRYEQAVGAISSDVEVEVDVRRTAVKLVQDHLEGWAHLRAWASS